MLGLFTKGFINEPKFPEFEVLKRLESFENSGRFVENKYSFAAAGFFFSENNPEYLTCFCCGGKLGNWTGEEDPFVEHAKYFPYCTHLLWTKGKQFVTSINSPKKEIITSETTKEINQSYSMSKKLDDEENKGVRICNNCNENEARILFLPCGHILTCRECLKFFFDCGNCEKEITGKFETYFS